jgi:hypothetical protein
MMEAEDVHPLIEIKQTFRKIMQAKEFFMAPV